MKKTYDKPPLTVEEQIILLRSRNLKVSNPQKAIDFLCYANYYRVSAYFLPFQDQKDVFREGTDFSNIIQLYHFDRLLRNLLWEAIGSIEIQFRTKIAYHLSTTLNDQFPQYKTNNFYCWEAWQEKLQCIAQKIIEKSKEDFIKHYQSTYFNFPQLPIWAFTEVITFGNLSFLFRCLKRNLKKQIAKDYGVHWTTLTSWMHSLSVTRNICAHHARVWNRNFSIKPKIPQKQRPLWENIRNDKLFFILLILVWLLKKCKGTDFLIPEWQEKIETLINSSRQKIPIPSFLEQMGMYDKWEQHTIWKMGKEC
ncbi:MAG: Abi family protein [Thermovirga sp.]|nr:Abi family protein [Thermovirga sp.]